MDGFFYSSASEACEEVEGQQSGSKTFVVAAIVDGLNRSEAARIGGMDR